MTHCQTEPAVGIFSNARLEHWHHETPQIRYSRFRSPRGEEFADYYHGTAVILPFVVLRFPSMYLLLTGATGLLGRYLLRDLSLRQVPLAVICAPNDRPAQPTGSRPSWLVGNGSSPLIASARCPVGKLAGSGTGTISSGPRVVVPPLLPDPAFRCIPEVHAGPCHRGAVDQQCRRDRQADRADARRCGFANSITCPRPMWPVCDRAAYERQSWTSVKPGEMCTKRPSARRSNVCAEARISKT